MPWLVARASRALWVAANASPQLSTDTMLDRCQSRMLDAVRAIRREPLRALACSASVPPGRTRLQSVHDSAYQLALIG
jgi:hypothetical protein